MSDSIEELRKGYDIITGLDNSEMTDAEITEYMEELTNEND